MTFGSLEKLRKMIKTEKEKKTTSVSSVCLHGEENCVRCASEDFEANQTNEVNWRELDNTDIKKVIFSLPFKVRESIRRNPGKVVLAGGYIRSIVTREQPRDIDLFVNGEKDAKSICNSVKMSYKNKDKHLVVNLKGTEVQVVWRYPFTTPIDVPDQFDYTIVKAGIWFGEGDKKTPAGFRSACHPRFYQDLARKVLVYESAREVEQASGFPRLLKYAAYGYDIEPKSLVSIVSKMVLNMDPEKGFDGMLSELEAFYTPAGTDEEWKKFNTTYVKPKPKPRQTYSYGS